jgi:CubicO group peptidase (beta-lactamase class C family)
MSFRKTKAWRVARWILALLVIGFLGLFVVASVLFSPVTALRALAWGQADVYDYDKFPSRPLRAPEQAFLFPAAHDEDRVRSAWMADPEAGDLESFLVSSRTQAFLVIQDGRVLYEGYFNGFERDSIATSFSVAKSFDSALIGIAIDEGAIGSIDDPITRYLPELLDRDARFSEITVRDLLLMSAGLRYVEAFPYGDDVRTYLFPDLRSQALTQTEIVDPPGEYFHYNNYHPLLLGMILERATGMPVAAYLEQKLWQPLGMEFDGSWSLDSAASGFEKMESGINARAIDFAKLGWLYLNRGCWNGQQVIPAGWIEESLSPDPAVRDPGYYPDDFGAHIFQVAEGGYYKYMWYGLLREGEANDFAAQGNLGQFIYVSPSRRLVIVRHGETMGAEWYDWIEHFYRLATELPAGEAAFPEPLGAGCEPLARMN